MQSQRGPLSSSALVQATYYFTASQRNRTHTVAYPALRECGQFEVCDRFQLVSSSFVDGRAGQEGCATSRPPRPLIRYRTRKFKLNFDKHDFEGVDTRTAKLPL